MEPREKTIMAATQMAQLDEPRETFLERAKRDLTACEAEQQAFHWKRDRVDGMVAEFRAAVNAAKNDPSDIALCQAYVAIHLRMQGWWFEGEFKRIFRETLQAFGNNGLILKKPVPTVPPVVDPPLVSVVPAATVTPIAAPTPTAVLITPSVPLAVHSQPTVVNAEEVKNPESAPGLNEIIEKKDALLESALQRLDKTKTQLRQEKTKTRRLEEENARLRKHSAQPKDAKQQGSEEKHSERPTAGSAPRSIPAKPTFPERGYHSGSWQGGSRFTEGAESSSSSSYTP